MIKKHFYILLIPFLGIQTVNSEECGGHTVYIGESVFHETGCIDEDDPGLAIEEANLLLRLKVTTYPCPKNVKLNL